MRRQNSGRLRAKCDDGHCSKRLILLPAIVILAGAALSARAARQPELKFLRTTDLPDVGLRVSLMPDATPTPLAPAKTYTYTFRRGDSTWKSEMYAPHELWVRSQHGGRWVDEDGNVLVIASICYPFPGPFESEHVTRETYEKAADDISRKAKAWDAETITKWVVDFTGASNARSQTVSGRFFRLKNLVRFEFDGKSANTMAYTFRVNRRTVADCDDAEDWMFALFEVNPAIPAGKARATIEEAFFGKLSALTVSPSRSADLSSSFQAGRPGDNAARSQEFLDSMSLAVESIRNMEGWWHAETDNYVFLSNLGSRHRVMIRDLQGNVELLRSAYETLLPPRSEIKAVSVIRIFASPEEYVSYVGEKHKWSGGIWMSDQKELVIRPIDWGGSKDQRDRVVRVTYHEAFHQYIFYALDQLRTSAWFNEGHAEVFENAEIRNRQFVVEESEKSCEVLDGMIKRDAVPIDEILRMDYEGFYDLHDNDEEKRQQNYALAWAMVYYLLKGAPLERPAGNADILKRYVDALWETRDPDKATAAAFAGTTVPRFKRDFLSFWMSRNRRSIAERNRLFTAQSLRAPGR